MRKTGGLKALGALAMAAMLVAGGRAPAQDTASRVWISTTDQGRLSRLDFNVRYDPVQSTAEAIVLEGEVASESPTGAADISARVYNGQGEVVHTGRVRVAIEEEVNPYRFTWDLSELPDGRYVVRIELERERSGVLAWAELEALKLSEAHVAAQLDAASLNLQNLERHFDRLGVDRPKSWYVTAPMRLARDSIELARQIERDWKRVRALAHYVDRTCDRLRARLAFEPGPLPMERPGKQLPIHQAQAKEGMYYVNGVPVFLGGLAAAGSPAEAVRQAGRYGLNFAAVGTSTGDLTDTATGALFDAADEQGVGVYYGIDALPREGSIDLGGHATPEAAGKAAVQSVAGRLQRLRERPQLIAASLAYQPVFRLEGDPVQQAFVQAMRSQYDAYYDLNWSWKTRLPDFESAAIWAEYDHPAYQFDWQTFHQTLVTRYIAGMTEAAKSIAPGLPVALTLDDAFFKPGQTAFGINEESILPALDVAGVAASMSPLDPVFAVSFPRETMYYTLLRSFRPSRPIINIQPGAPQPAALSPEKTRRYMRTLVFEGAVEGLDGLALNGWHSDPDTPGTFVTTPEAMEGFVTGVLDVNRLGPIVAAFQQAPAELGILWSRSARILNRGEAFLSSASRAFEGVSFSGMKVRFITEQQVIEEGFGDLRVLVIPETLAIDSDAIQRIEDYAAERQGVIIRAGKPMPYDSRGHSRPETISFTGSVLLVRGEDVSTEYLDATDAAAFQQELGQVPRAINSHGYPLEGVRTRYVEYEGEAYLYIVNLRNNPVQCHLFGGPRRGLDLVSGQRVRFPMRLPSLAPKLVRLDTMPPPEQVAQEDTGAEPATPSAQIGPPPPPDDPSAN